MSIGAVSLFDSPNQPVLAEASSWIEAALLGSVGTAIAVAAVAWLGMLMLRGHLPLRRAGAILFGCFILFGASAIARGMVDMAGRGAVARSTVASPPSPISNVPRSSQIDDRAPAYDPYAGAAVPRR